MPKTKWGVVEMDQSIRALHESLSSVRNHVESSSRELADAVSQRPTHLDMTRSSFPWKLEHRAEAAAADLQHIESISLGTVSFEELLSHCGEALNVCARHASALQSHLASFGHEPAGTAEPEVDVDVEDGDVSKVEDLGDGSIQCSGRAEVTQRHNNAREVANRPIVHSHEDLAQKLQVYRMIGQKYGVDY